MTGLHLRSCTTEVAEGATSLGGWQLAVAEFGNALGYSPPTRHDESMPSLEVGVVGVSGVGKSALLNALIAPMHELLPSGGIGPLTGTPVRIAYAPTAFLRVKYLDRRWLLDALSRLEGSSESLTNNELGRLSLACGRSQYSIRDPTWLGQAIRYSLAPDVGKPPDQRPETVFALRSVHEILAHEGAVREWRSDAPDGAFVRRVHDHIAGGSAALCEQIDLGWPSAMLATGVVLVDLPGLGMANDSYARLTRGWLTHARAIVVVTDRAGVADSVITGLRSTGYLKQVIEGRADLIGVMTKLDHVADDVRRADGRACSWAACFRAVAARAEVELFGQLEEAFRREPGLVVGTRHGPDLRAAVRVFGVSSLEHRRVVGRDPEDRPRLHVAESSGIPAVRRALIALGRLRSSPWTSEILDRVRADRESAALCSELISLVDMEAL